MQCFLNDNTDHILCLTGSWCILLVHTGIFILECMAGECADVATLLHHVIFHLNVAVERIIM